MKLNDFELSIQPGRELPGGYVAMQHGQVYGLVLQNRWLRRAEAAVMVDGKAIGTFRLGIGQRLVLERPPNDTGRFTFYLAGTPEARQAAIVADGNAGLVQVTFTPEEELPKRTVVPVSRVTESGRMDAEYHLSATLDRPATMDSLNPTRSFSSHGPLKGSAAIEGQSMQAGGTGLSGHSGQQFQDVAALRLDHSQSTVISLRLVGETNEPRPLVSAGYLANPVPAPVS